MERHHERGPRAESLDLARQGALAVEVDTLVQALDIDVARASVDGHLVDFGHASARPRDRLHQGAVVGQQDEPLAV